MSSQEKMQEVTRLEVALEKNKDVKVRAEEAASDLSNAATVLKKTMAGGSTKLAAKIALKVGAEVEEKVQECADDLHDVNETLTQGVAELARTHEFLVELQGKLAKTQSALVAAQDGEKAARLDASHDSATGLPNREHFNARLKHDIAVAERHGLGLAVMFFDLNKFKSINDKHGHAAGDEVLKQVSARLLQHCRREDTVCRTGGDEFLYVLIEPKGRENVKRIATALLDSVSCPIPFGDAQIIVRPSIGISFYPDDGTTGEDLVKKADAAMYQAKRSANAAGWAFYDAAK